MERLPIIPNNLNEMRLVLRLEECTHPIVVSPISFENKVGSSHPPVHTC